MKPCKWCGGTHEAMCPRVKSMDFYSDGSVQRVEFFESWRPEPLISPELKAAIAAMPASAS